MPVNFSAADPASLHPIAGVRIGTVEAGVRKKNRKDVTLFLLDEGTSVGGVFTSNRFCAAPVQICQQQLAAGAAVRALIINTGNANAGTGADGYARAENICRALATQLQISPAQVLPFSTGVIMEPLPDDRIIAALPAAEQNAAPANWGDAATAIMTTDTVPKAHSLQAQVGGKTISITGISKGAGMIRPNMATMLGFMATDAAVAPALMQEITRRVADASFNAITVDGDTSTNDSFIIAATGQAGNSPVASLDSADGQALLAALTQAAQVLAQAIVRDGEGATKFITIRIAGGKTEAECKQVAYAIAHSPLVKTAFFASDPNWGRILAAVGYAGVSLDQSKVNVSLDEVRICERGGLAGDYTEEKGAGVMQRPEITIHIELGRGQASDTVYTCDLSYEYVKINADYRS